MQGGSPVGRYGATAAREWQVSPQKRRERGGKIGSSLRPLLLSVARAPFTPGARTSRSSLSCLLRGGRQQHEDVVAIIGQDGHGNLAFVVERHADRRRWIAAALTNVGDLDPVPVV